MKKPKKERSELITLNLSTSTLDILQRTSEGTGISIDLLIQSILTLHVVKEAQRIEREERGWI
jgi:hypothetical protein